MESDEAALVLQTSRLTLAVPSVSAAARVAEYHLRNKEHFATTAPPRPDGFYTVDYWRERLAAAHDDLAKGEAIRLFIFLRDAPEGRVMGDVTFSAITRGAFQACYLGYDLDEAQVGQGFMTEALQPAIAHVFSHVRLHRIMANYMPTNVRSARVLRRLGFIPEGFARDYLFLGGAWQDHVLTALVRS